MSKATKGTTKSAEFMRFQELTHNLLAVPKKEIEQKKAQHEKRKEAKRKGQPRD